MVLAFHGKFCVFNYKAVTGRRGGKGSGFSTKTKQSKSAKMNQTFLVAFLAFNQYFYPFSFKSVITNSCSS